MTAADMLIDLGRRIALREMLVEELRLRFGTLPEAALARVNAADTAQLDLWLERVPTATTLADVQGAMTDADMLIERQRHEVRIAERRETMLRLLRTLFGPLPEVAIARVKAADMAQLDTWFARAMKATATLADVQGDG